jgi:biopolymer transport protein ExbD
LDITLPDGSGQSDKSQPDKNDIRTVEITSQGSYAMNRRIMSLDQVINVLKQDHQTNPNIIVNIRADGNSYTKYFAALMDACSKNGITRYSLRETPKNQR